MWLVGISLQMVKTPYLEIWSYSERLFLAIAANPVLSQDLIWLEMWNKNQICRTTGFVAKDRTNPVSHDEFFSAAFP